MALPFVKLYHTILSSSVWLEPEATRLVWITMLVMADAEGVVRASVGGLAHQARISREACEAALVTLAGVDTDSRGPAEDGRRIIRAEGGWILVNARHYRELRTEDQIATAARVRKHREAKRSQAVTSNVTPRDISLLSTEVEGEEEAEAEKGLSPSGLQARVEPEASTTAARKRRAPATRSPTEALLVAEYETRMASRNLVPVKLGAALRRQVASWLDATAAQRQEPAAALVTRWLDHAFADPRFAAAGYPAGWLRQNPTQYLDARGATRASSYRAPSDWTGVPSSDPRVLFPESFKEPAT